ncbi:rod-binding protein [Erythrobacter sp.]|uniref:rod-binding protein n=1 Tax=Erythrobacter sp. TaxID=1042 RepID=UPI001425ED17|nr:rod-binding protein [Erythrobacter sp.]QIQ87146.1 MAG: flagellar biosynthesis protein FlgJ [Erythrobacter sp.]
MIPPVSPLSPATLSPERRELREAAQGFEAIMVRRMLASARAASFAEDTPLTGGGMEQFTAMRDEHLAEIVSKSGALGFARSIEERLAQHLSGQGEA